MNNLTQKTTTTETAQKQFGLWTAGILSLLGLAFFLYDLYVVLVLQKGRFDLSDSILMPMAALMFLLGLTSLLLVLRNRHSLGTILLFYSFVVVPPIIAIMLLQSIISVVVLYLFIIASVMVGWVLPKTFRIWAIISVAITIAVCLGIEDWDPGFRVRTGMGNFANITTGLSTLFILALIIFQFRKNSLQLTRKLLVPTIIVFSLVITGLITYYAITTTQQFDAAEEARLKNMSEVFNARLKAKADLAVALATDVANNPEVQAAFAAKDRERLIELTLPSYQVLDEQFDVPQFQFHIPPATSFLRLHSLENFGDDLSSFRFTVLAANAERRSVSGPELGRGGLGVRGVVPVNYQGRHIGTVEFGTDIGSTLIEELKSDFGYDFQILLSRVPAEVATFEGVTEKNQGPLNELLFQVSTLDTPLFASAANYTNALAGSSTTEHINVGSLEYAVYSLPLYDYSGNVIGVVDIISDHTVIAQQQNTRVILSAVVLLAILLVSGSSFAYFTGRTLRPVGELTSIAGAIAAGDFDKKTNVTSNDELGTLAQAFDSMTGQLQSLFGSLEQRVADRTRNLELAAEVGRAVSQVRDLDTMLRDATELIRARFDLYYTQVYLTNPSQTELILQAGTGEVGEQLRRRGHRLSINTASINGRAVIEKRAVIISDTSASATFHPNPLLLETRSEMAVPLMIGDKVVGVLDMQSKNAGALNEETLSAFSAMAGQLAVAISNANLLAAAEEARTEVEAQAGRLTRANWKDYLDAINKAERVGFVYENNEIIPLVEDEIQLSSDGKTISSPIAISGEMLGSLVVEMNPDNQVAHSAELVNVVARQVAQQIENLRLLESAERYRLEAEGTTRRATIKGWKEYIEARGDASLGYLYDSNEVVPAGINDFKSNEKSITLPLKTREETIGKLAIMGVEEQDTESLGLATAVAERLSSHIENLRLFEETKRGQVELDKRARELESVAEISSVSARELDIHKMLETVVFLTQRRFGLYHAHVFTYNEFAKHLQIVACGWKEGDIHEGTHGTTTIALEQERSLVARAAREKRAVVVNDVQSDPGWLPNPLLPDTRSEMAVPLLVGDQLLGVLDVQKDYVNAFTDEDTAVVSTLATQVATALQNAHSFEQAQKQADRESMLNVISQKIQSATTVEAVLQIAARELGHALGAPLTIAQLGVKNGND